MASQTRFNAFVEDLAEKVHNLGSDTLKLALTNSAPVATNTVLANITQIAATGGYSSGGYTITRTSSAQTSGAYKLILADLVITASGGVVGPFRYAVIYNSTAASGPLISWVDYGSAITLADTETFTADFDGSLGVLSL